MSIPNYRPHSAASIYSMSKLRVGCYLFIAATTLVWTAYTWWFLYYMSAEYIFNPRGEWKRLPGICCELYQKAPLYIHILGAAVALVLGPLQLINTVCRLPCHMYTGILYAVACAFAASGGITFAL